MPDNTNTNTTRRLLRLMPDYHCFSLWESGADPYNVDPDDLPLSQELKQRLWRWAAAYDATLNHDDPPDSQFATPAERTAFLDEGEQLCTALRAELGSGYTVAYHPLS
jgi:hypothetical protein